MHFLKKFLTLYFFLAPSIHSGYAQQCASLIIRQTLELENFSSSLQIGSEKINAPRLLTSFYANNSFELSWLDQRNVMDLLEALYHSDEEGLNREDYHFEILEEYLYGKEMNEPTLANIDMLLTDAFLTYGTHLLSGKIDPQLLYPGKWDTKKRHADLLGMLEVALAHNSIHSVLKELKPNHAQYMMLREQLAYFRIIQKNGGWLEIPAGNVLVPGDSSERISFIKKRLRISGQLPTPAIHEEILYDTILEGAIKKFQAQHGLEPDGEIGVKTLQVLNFPVEKYIGQIKVNLERIRWLPWDLGNRYILVNIPDFHLYVKENDSVVLKMKTIVGKKERSTPIFSSYLQYVILNPTWTVPPTILKEDVLPAIKNDIHYLQRHNLRLFSRQGEEINPENLPWGTFTERNFPYQIRQDPGLYNSMGLIKFHLANHYSVFLHDTNARYLFNHTYRALSSGCIRVEQPFSLAAYLLKDTTWTRKNLDSEISAGKTKTIVFTKPIPVHIVYLTAFVDGHNDFQWREDIYALDGAVLYAIDY